MESLDSNPGLASTGRRTAQGSPSPRPYEFSSAPTSALPGVAGADPASARFEDQVRQRRETSDRPERTEAAAQSSPAASARPGSRQRSQGASDVDLGSTPGEELPTESLGGPLAAIQSDPEVPRSPGEGPAAPAGLPSPVESAGQAPGDPLGGALSPELVGGAVDGQENFRGQPSAPIEPGAGAGRLEPQTIRALESAAAPKPTELPNPTPARAEAVLAQVRTVLRPGLRRADIELFPRELGRVQVRLEVSRGEVSAVLRVESAEALAALQQGSADLRGAFERAQLTLSDLRFEFADPGSQDKNGRAPDQDRGRPRAGQPKGSVTQITSRSIPNSPVGASSASSGIDTLA